MNKLAYYTGYMEKTAETAEKPYKPVMAERVVGLGGQMIGGTTAGIAGELLGSRMGWKRGKSLKQKLLLSLLGGLGGGLAGYIGGGYAGRKLGQTIGALDRPEAAKYLKGT